MDIGTSNTVVAKNIKNIIEDRSLKQSAIAKKAGFSTQEFNAMLNGRRLIKAIEMVSIMNVLDVDANTLFAESASKGWAGER
ncbi:MAG: helix-turn-helix transcriptional regulator [Lachnospiraceae bacterium]|nr:helix-turn-helix transcriptional regulator [Lachnospiraceae bacterium]